jgi:hypothetical protein
MEKLLKSKNIKMATIKIPRTVLGQLHAMTIGSSDLKIVKYGKRIKDIVDVSSSFINEIDVDQQEIIDSLPNICDDAKSILSPYLPKEPSYLVFPKTITGSGSPVYIGMGYAPDHLSGKCLIIEKTISHNKPIVEVSEYDDRWIIAIKVN